jgi:predicted flap endonuclease-1-like 5' DNA nuclease
MIYLIVNARDPFTPYLLSALTGSVPLFPYVVLSLTATFILLVMTFFTLTSAIQADTRALLHKHIVQPYLVSDPSAPTPTEVVPSPITATMTLASAQDASIYALNEQVQALNEALAQPPAAARTLTEQDTVITSATRRVPRANTRHVPANIEATSNPPFALHNTLRALNGIGPKTERMFHGIGITTIGELLVADPEWVAEHTPLTIRRIQHFQEIAYARVAGETQEGSQFPAITPTTA